ncbi:hypothetical protein T439DRAFT_198347 [Meredithblackwellia eburnea MCA 4105]
MTVPSSHFAPVWPISRAQPQETQANSKKPTPMDCSRFSVEVEDDLGEPGGKEEMTEVRISFFDEYHVQVGFAIVLFCNITRAMVKRRGGFHSMVERSSDAFERLARVVFDDRAKIQRRFRCEGNRLWGPEVTTEQVAFLEHLEVGPEFQGMGVGSWFVRQVWLGDGFANVPKAPFLFVRPAPLVSTDSSASIADSLAHRSQTTSRLRSFYRKTGFRRVGSMDYFSLAKDPGHPSRRSPENEDWKLQNQEE